MLYYYHGELSFIIGGVSFQQAAAHIPWQNAPLRAGKPHDPGTPFMIAWHSDHLLPQKKPRWPRAF